MDYRNTTCPKEYLPNLSAANSLSSRVASTRIVFRVFDSQSFRKYDPEMGFVATGFNTSGSLNDQQLADAHLNWKNRTIVTPWLSTSRRWHWTVWEMNRRFEERFSSSLSQKSSSTDIGVAVINLEACRETARPPVHALSILSPTSERRKFANISDEILIYGRIPQAAILSVRWFEQIAGIQGLPRSISLRIPSGNYLSYRDVHSCFVELLYNPSYAQEWKGQNGGELCARIAISMMQAGYERLELQVDRIVEPIQARKTSGPSMNSHNDLVDSLVEDMVTLSAAPNAKTNVIGSELPHGSKMEQAINLLNKGANLFHTAMTQSRQEITSAIRYIDSSSQHEYAILGAYSALLTQYKTVKDRLSASTPGEAGSPNRAYEQLLRIELLFFRAQKQGYEAVLAHLARQRIEFFRSVVLEFARTVPLGLVDRLDIGSQEWSTIKLGMLGRVDAWLSPLDQKLEGLEDEDVPELIHQAKHAWLMSEISYPIYWETLGVQQRAHGTVQTGSERYYTYLTNNA